MRLYNMAVSILFSVLAINVNAVTSKNESLCSLMLSDPTIDFLEGQEAVEALSALPLGSVSSVDGTVVAGLDYFQSKLDQEDSLLENWLNHSIAHDDLKLEEKSGLSADRKLVAKLAGPSIGKVWIKTNKEVAQIDVLKQIKKDLQKKLGLWITAEEVRPISISSDNKTLIVSFGGNLTVTRGYKGKTEETNELQELNATMNLNPLERMFVTNRLGIAYIDIQSRKVTKTFVLPHNEGSLRVLPDKKKALLVNHYGSMSQVNLDVTYGKAFQDLQAQSKKNRYFYDIRVDLMTFLEEISKNLLRDEIDEGELFWFPFLRRSFQSNENGSVKPIANVRSGLLLHENQNQGDYLVFFKTEPAVGLPYLASGYRFLISDLSDKLKGFSRLSRIELIEEKGAYVLLKLTDMSFREKIVRIKNISSDSLEEILVFDSEENQTFRMTEKGHVLKSRTVEGVGGLEVSLPSGEILVSQPNSLKMLLSVHHEQNGIIIYALDWKGKLVSIRNNPQIHQNAIAVKSSYAIGDRVWFLYKDQVRIGLIHQIEGKNYELLDTGGNSIDVHESKLAVMPPKNFRVLQQSFDPKSDRLVFYGQNYSIIGVIGDDYTQSMELILSNGEEHVFTRLKDILENDSEAKIIHLQ